MREDYGFILAIGRRDIFSKWQVLIQIPKINEQMQFCNNCQKSLPDDKFDLHLGYCRRNIKRCADCNRPYDINDAEQHEEEFHNFQQCQHCKDQIATQHLPAHLKTCKFKPIECTYCQMTVPTDKYDQHRQQCEARTKPCEKCKRPIINKQYFNHLTTCSGQPPLPSSTSTSNQSSNSFYSASQPRTYPIGTTNSISSSSNSQATSYYNYNYATAANTGSPPVIRTYTRTYVQGSSPGTNYDQTSINRNVVSSTEATLNGYSPSSEGRIISRRVISTRVVPPQELNYNPSSSASTYQTYYTSPASSGTVSRTYVSPSTTTYISGTNAEYSHGHDSKSNSYDQDPELQAALMASLGYNDIGSSAVYEAIQNQHRLEKQIRK